MLKHAIAINFEINGDQSLVRLKVFDGLGREVVFDASQRR
jgi:hypothetical protein